ncbi:MAG TPA: hypothetical protein VJB90_02125 [Candidatus Nanoarchaeia archaeon]|nr:hypothetical protein [Candidatus Nanoarchaeia archaeon]
MSIGNILSDWQVLEALDDFVEKGANVVPRWNISKTPAQDRLTPICWEIYLHRVVWGNEDAIKMLMHNIPPRYNAAILYNGTNEKPPSYRMNRTAFETMGVNKQQLALLEVVLQELVQTGEVAAAPSKS